MYQAHREAYYTDISYTSTPSLPSSCSNPPHFHPLSSDSSFSTHHNLHSPLPPPLDPYPNSGLNPPNYTSFEDRASFHSDPNALSSSWVVKQAPPVRYSPVVQPQIQQPETSTQYDASLYTNWASQNLITNGRKSKLKRPKAIMKKKSASQNVRCQLCKIECTSIELYEKHLSGKRHSNNLQKLYAPKIATQAGQASKGTAGGKGIAGVTKVDLETKKRKLLEGGTAVQSLRVCTICNVACNGEIALADHMAGKKHLTQERALINVAYTQPTSTTNPKPKSNNGPAWCEVCKISCTNKEGLEIHKQGKKHKKNLQKLQNPNGDPINPASTPAWPLSAKSKEPEDVETKKRKVLASGTSEDAVRACTICNVVCNSETVFSAHLAGQKHAAMVKQTTRTMAGAVAEGQQLEHETPAT